MLRWTFGMSGLVTGSTSFALQHQMCWLQTFGFEITSDERSAVAGCALMIVTERENEGAGMPKPDFSKIYGKVREVNIGEDYKVRVVQIGEDLRVRKVSMGANGPGQWEMVSIGEKFKIRFVSIGEDFTVRFG